MGGRQVEQGVCGILNKPLVNISRLMRRDHIRLDCPRHQASERRLAIHLLSMIVQQRTHVAFVPPVPMVSPNCPEELRRLNGKSIRRVVDPTERRLTC